MFGARLRRDPQQRRLKIIVVGHLGDLAQLRHGDARDPRPAVAHVEPLDGGGGLRVVGDEQRLRPALGHAV